MVNKQKQKLISSLIEEGYCKEFAVLCADSMVSKESFIDHIVDTIKKCYDNSMLQMQNANEDLRSFVSCSLIESMKDFSPRICENSYSGFSILNNSFLLKTAFAIYGGVWFIIFDKEVEGYNDKIFHDLLDWLIFHDKEREEIQMRIEKFDK